MAIIEQEVKRTTRPTFSELNARNTERVEFGFRSRQEALPEYKIDDRTPIGKAIRRSMWGRLEDTYHRLQQLVHYHRYLYYVKHGPMLSDVEYDEIHAELEDFERCFPHMITLHSPTQTGPSDDPRDYPDSIRYACEKGLPYVRKPAYEWAMPREE